MPRRNVFIRQEDIDAWDTMRNRPDWLHKKLVEYKNAHLGVDLTDVKTEKNLGEIIADSSQPDELPPQIIAGIEDAEE